MFSLVTTGYILYKYIIISFQDLLRKSLINEKQYLENNSKTNQSTLVQLQFKAELFQISNVKPFN